MVTFSTWSPRSLRGHAVARGHYAVTTRSLAVTMRSLRGHYAVLRHCAVTRYYAVTTRSPYGPHAVAAVPTDDSCGHVRIWFEAKNSTSLQVDLKPHLRFKFGSLQIGLSLIQLSAKTMLHVCCNNEKDRSQTDDSRNETGNWNETRSRIHFGR